MTCGSVETIDNGSSHATLNDIKGAHLKMKCHLKNEVKNRLRWTFAAFLLLLWWWERLIVRKDIIELHMFFNNMQTWWCLTLKIIFGCLQQWPNIKIALPSACNLLEFFSRNRFSRRVVITLCSTRIILVFPKLFFILFSRVENVQTVKLSLWKRPKLLESLQTQEDPFFV